MEKLYWGDKQIIGFEDTGRETQSGIKIVKILLQNNQEIITTEKARDAVVSTKKLKSNDKDGGVETQIRNRKVVPLVEEILAVMRDSNLAVSEVDYAVQLVVDSINHNMNNASNKLWSVEHSGDRTLLDADAILREEK